MKTYYTHINVTGSTSTIDLITETMRDNGDGTDIINSMMDVFETNFQHQPELSKLMVSGTCSISYISCDDTWIFIELESQLPTPPIGYIHSFATAFFDTQIKVETQDEDGNEIILSYNNGQYMGSGDYPKELINNNNNLKI